MWWVRNSCECSVPIPGVGKRGSAPLPPSTASYVQMQGKKIWRRKKTAFRIMVFIQRSCQPTPVYTIFLKFSLTKDMGLPPVNCLSGSRFSPDVVSILRMNEFNFIFIFNLLYIFKFQSIDSLMFLLALSLPVTYFEF